MHIEDLYQYLGKKYKVTCDTMAFPRGTIIEIKSIDIRKLNNNAVIRFRCIKNNDKTKDDAYLQTYEFITSIGNVLKKI